MFTLYTVTMKANNLTISVPTPECKNDCPYCVSKMTACVTPDVVLFNNNLDKLATIIAATQVTSILVTGKGEPLDATTAVKNIGLKFKQYPLELQTKGMQFLKYPSLVELLRTTNYNVIAISIDHPHMLITFQDVFKAIVESGMIIRLTIVVSDTWKDITLAGILQVCKESKISQLTFRIPTIPTKLVDSSDSRYAQRWIERHKPSPDTELSRQINAACNNENFVRSLPFGAKIYDVEGIGLSIMDSCIQENSDSEDIRSLIYQADGHLYTTWDKKGSILF